MEDDLNKKLKTTAAVLCCSMLLWSGDGNAWIHGQEYVWEEEGSVPPVIVSLGDLYTMLKYHEYRLRTHIKQQLFSKMVEKNVFFFKSSRK
jgi:hypothetical protein